MPLLFCESAVCRNNQKKGELKLELITSKFVKYQEVKIQESPARVPAGSIPRSQKLVVKGSLTRKLLPGMSVILAGILTPLQKEGYRAMRSSLVTETTFNVQDVMVQKHRLYDLAPAEIAKIERSIMERHQNDPALYETLARSIAPSIHGLDDVKKTLLLQLVGGVTENFKDGMQLRGDIHVLLMGDPGVAKSQLLGQICKIAPRAHYTTGEREERKEKREREI